MRLRVGNMRAADRAGCPGGEAAPLSGCGPWPRAWADMARYDVSPGPQPSVTHDRRCAQGHAWHVAASRDRPTPRALSQQRARPASRKPVKPSGCHCPGHETGSRAHWQGWVSVRVRVRSLRSFVAQAAGRERRRAVCRGRDLPRTRLLSKPQPTITCFTRGHGHGKG